ncbi:hypothetical protein IEQ34_023945 [Dendrobium chrysotoxum]|uniref:Uncharacterized protein n=1 Tax=Dendrobium chrysotoxum TaxID=161865 RepID=A0AAV7FJL0_DENCH|nr:hypothetical protein IEQ34_023945 [Dendrobium chrysotoxum]
MGFGGGRMKGFFPLPFPNSLDCHQFQDWENIGLVVGLCSLGLVGHSLISWLMDRHAMPTIKQLLRNARQPIRNVTKSPALRGCPQRRGTCTRVYVRLVQFRS